MKALKSTLFAGVLAASLAMPAFANDVPAVAPLPQFTAADTQMLFEHDAKPMQLAVLSQQEMKETEGARIPPWIFNTRANVRYDYKPHNFGSWIGNRPHYQADFYIKGQKDSNFLTVRIPWGPRTQWGSHKP